MTRKMRKFWIRGFILALAALFAGVLALGTLPAFAAESVKDYDQFKDAQVFDVTAVKTGGVPYSSGVPTSSDVSVTMKFKNTPDASVRFQYAAVPKGTAFDSIKNVDDAGVWRAFTAIDSTTGADVGIDRTDGNDITRDFRYGDTGTDGATWLYFRSVYSVTVQGQPMPSVCYYSDREPLSLYIVPKPTVESLQIRAEARKSATDSEYAAYNGTEWIANDVRFTVSVPKYVDCFYKTVDRNGTVSEAFPLGANPENENERILSITKENFPAGFEGNVAFSYNDVDSGLPTEDPSYVKPVCFDPAAPEFSVAARFRKDGVEEAYLPGMTSASAVTYEISAPEGTQNLSGVEYYYYTSQNPPSRPTDPGVTKLNPTNGKFVYTVYATTRNLRFMAVSGSGVVSLPHERNYETVIDDKTPVAKVTATDGRGKELLYDGGDPVWASQSVTFVLSNATDNVGAKFEYRTGDRFTEMPIVNGQYSVTINFPAGYEKSTLTDQSVYFRVTSAAGVASDTIPFRFSLAKSDFTFGFRMDEFVPDVWVNAPLNLAFTTDTTDYTFGYRVQNNDPEKLLIPLEGVWETLAETGEFVFQTQLAGSVNGFAVNFYAVNLAGVECSESKATPSPLRLDTEYAKLDLRGAINGAAEGSFIEEGQWVNGNVVLTFFSAGANISGYSIVKLIKNGDEYFEDERGALSKDTAGNFTDSLAYTGVYYYNVKTGAGKTERIAYRVNIDDTPIEMLGYEVRAGETGEWMSPADASDFLAQHEISDNLFLRFLSNHTTTDDAGTVNHFVYYYALDGASQFIRGTTGGIYVYDLSEKTDSGSVRISFYLESTAIDRTGAATNTKADTRELTFRYNRIGATLTVALDAGASATDWNFAPVTFSLKNDKDLGSTGDFRYEYSVDGGVSWRQIVFASFDGSTHIGKFVYGGEGVHLNGVVRFRVLNAAGYASEKPVEVALKLDTTSPDALRSAAFDPAVSYTKEAGTGTEPGTLYYSGKLQLAAPSDPSYAPTSFYYSTAGAERPAGAPSVGAAILGWTLLTDVSGFNAVKSLTISFFATNGHATDYQVWKVDLDDSDESSLKLNVGWSNVDGETDGNLFIFRWAQTNRVFLTAFGSATPVKYYYSFLGSDVWTEMEDQGQNPSEWQMPGEEFSYTFSAAMRENVRFRAVNKGGRIMKGDQTVVLQIDTTEVAFTIEASVGGQPYDAATGANNGWSNYDVLFEIVQTSLNPSGVNYQYALGDYAELNPPAGASWQKLVNTRLSSLLLDTTNNGNLQGRLWIRVAKNAAPNVWTQHSVPFRVDKLKPNFEMEATYTDAAGAFVTVRSGEWFNSLKADGSGTSPVQINLIHPEETYDPVADRTYKNASHVTYSYRTTGDWQSLNETSLSFQYVGAERTKITFRAVSEAGLSVEKTFELNIDNLAPEFRNGNNNRFSISQGEGGSLNTYYVDQVIRWINESEESLDEATVNGLPLTNGGVVSTHDTYLGTPGTEDYGKVTLIVQDKAKNRAELTFILKPFPLTVETISLDEADIAQLNAFDEAVADASSGEHGALKDNSRRQYFTNMISRLRERLEMLKTQISEFQKYLEAIYNKASFTLESDYDDMSEQIETFRSYPVWQQASIRAGSFDAQGRTVEYRAAYDRLIERFTALQNLMDQVEKVEVQTTLLSAVKDVEKTDYDDIMKAYSAYQSLTSDQKSKFDTFLYKKLFNCKERCEILLLQNDGAGVRIEGDTITGGAMLSANEVSAKTERYATVQKKILAEFPDGVPRALIKLVDVALLDFGTDASATPTGKIAVTIDIPAEYQNYLKFAVYIVGANNGTLVKAEGVTIAPDGKSVRFETTGLGTYALTNEMNVVDQSEGGKVYGQILGVTIDGETIVYILIGVAGLVLVLILVVILTGFRKRKFLKRYDKRYTQGLAARGVYKVPKGNKSRRTHPFDDTAYIGETKLVEPPAEKPKKVKKKKKSDESFDLDD